MNTEVPGEHHGWLQPSTPNAAPRQERKKRTSISAQSVDSQDLTQAEVDLKPWKYIGYKGYSSFLASENDFFVVRRFSAISIRIALRLQDQVTILEKRLDEIDKRSNRREAKDENNGTFRDDSEERLFVLDELGNALMKFSRFYTLFI
jgi:hypothetical protein